MAGERRDPAQIRPWWIPPGFSAPADVEPRLLRLLGFVGLALLFENYDFSLLTSSLRHIARDLAIAETDLGTFTSLIRLGALPALLVVPFADLLGRRRVFLAAVIGLSVGTLLTGFSQTPGQFIVAQIATRTCMTTAATLAIVIIAEEFPAAHRGWGIGMLAALGGVGHGLGAALFAAVDVLPLGWRALYAAGIVPVLLLPRFRAGVVETDRFRRREVGDRSVRRAWWQPLVELAVTHPARAAGIAIVGATTSLGQASVYQFVAFYVQEYRGWQPWQFSLLLILGGAIGLLGNVAAGRFGDRFGRRIVGAAVMAAFPLFAWGFFFGPSVLLPAVWILLLFALVASNVIVRAFATELFPTSHRGTAAGWLLFCETVGAAAGLALVSFSQQSGLDLPSAATAASFGSLVGAAVVLAFPETRQLELELTSGEAPPRALVSRRRFVE